MSEQDRLLRLPEVVSIVGLRRSAIYALERVGKFPKKIALGKTTVWSLREVSKWVEARIAERDVAGPERQATGARLREARKRLKREQGAPPSDPAPA